VLVEGAVLLHQDHDVFDVAEARRAGRGGGEGCVQKLLLRVGRLAPARIPAVVPATGRPDTGQRGGTEGPRRSGNQFPATDIGFVRTCGLLVAHGFLR
jgi:hypothetical protein